MKNLDLLPLPSEVKERLAKFAQQYLQLTQIAIEVVSFKDNWLIVRVEQKKVNEKQLTKWQKIAFYYYFKYHRVRQF